MVTTASAVLKDSAVNPPLNVTERSSPPTNPTLDDFYVDDGTNTASGTVGWRHYNGTAWEDVSAGAGGGASLPVVDTTSIVEGSVDSTKEMRIEVDGLTTGTIRVATMPDEDTILGGGLPSPTELTIASGVVTKTQKYHSIDTESDFPTDDLGTINGGTADDILYIYAASDIRDVVIKHNAGNIQTYGGTDITLDSTFKVILLIYNGTVWREVSNSSTVGGGAPTTATYITQTADGGLSSEQALSLLSSGIMRVATTTGVITSLAEPSGTLVGTSDSQTLTNKTIDADNSTITNIGAAEVKVDLISGQTADATPDGAADFVLTQDVSAGTLKKVLLNNLPSSGGGATPTFFHGEFFLSSNIDITSGTYADIDATNIKQSVTLTGGETVVAKFYLSNVTQITGGTGTYKLVAGTTDADTVVEVQYGRSADDGSLTLVGQWTGLVAATHDFKPQFKTSANTARVETLSPVTWEVIVYA